MSQQPDEPTDPGIQLPPVNSAQADSVEEDSSLTPITEEHSTGGDPDQVRERLAQMEIQLNAARSTIARQRNDLEAIRSTVRTPKSEAIEDLLERVRVLEEGPRHARARMRIDRLDHRVGALEKRLGALEESVRVGLEGATRGATLAEAQGEDLMRLKGLLGDLEEELRELKSADHSVLIARLDQIEEMALEAGIGVAEQREQITTLTSQEIQLPEPELDRDEILDEVRALIDLTVQGAIGSTVQASQASVQASQVDVQAEVRAAVDAAVQAAVQAAVDAAVEEAVKAAVGEAVKAAVDAAVEEALKSLPAPAAAAPAEATTLRSIKGIGPKTEKALIELGIERPEQVAAWDDAEITRLAEALSTKVSRLRSWAKAARALVGEPAAQPAANSDAGPE